MGDYTKRRFGRQGPRGARPSEEGVGFAVEFLELPGQENDDDPVTAYRVVDRHDGETVLNGVEVKSKARELANRQIWLMTKASGMVGEQELIETQLDPMAPPEDETQEQMEARLGLEEMCVKIGNQLDGEMPEGIGFTLLMFNFGEGGHLAYLSNAQRADMLDTMREFLSKHGAIQ